MTRLKTKNLVIGAGVALVGLLLFAVAVAMHGGMPDHVQQMLGGP